MSVETKLYFYFALIKLAGYVLACVLLARYYKKSSWNGGLAGFVRTLIGMGTGILFFYGPHFLIGLSGPVLSSLLIPVRAAEWGLVFWLFFGRPFVRKPFPMILPAIVWSFVLDALGAFLLSGLIRAIIC